MAVKLVKPINYKNIEKITDADFEKIYGGQLTEEDYNETRTIKNPDSEKT